MEIKRFTKRNLKKFEFVNDYGYTRYGFHHDTTLFENGVKIATHRCNYINRTWECYTYQTVMLCAVDDLIAEKRDEIIENYKRTNNIKRLTKDKKALAEKEVAKDKRIKELKALQKELRGYNF